MRRIKIRVVRRLSMLILTVVFLFAITATHATAATIFESGKLGPTGIAQGFVAATNVNQFVYPGVRFQLTQPAITSHIGGHFVSQSNGTFFGAIVKLDNDSDYPNSANLSTPDVLGTATLAFPTTSEEVYGGLILSLDPGWYALVFGSGLFGTSGDGAAPRNNPDIGDPAYIGYGPNLGWFNLDILQTSFDNHRFVVRGTVVPEPGTLTTVLFLLVACWSRRSSTTRMHSR